MTAWPPSLSLCPSPSHAHTGTTRSISSCRAHWGGWTQAGTGSPYWVPEMPDHTQSHTTAPTPTTSPAARLVPHISHVSARCHTRDPTLTLEEDRRPLAVPGWRTVSGGHCHSPLSWAWPHPASPPLCSPKRGRLRASPHWLGALASPKTEEGRNWFLKFDPGLWKILGSPRTKGPRRCGGGAAWLLVSLPPPAVS